MSGSITSSIAYNKPKDGKAIAIKITEGIKVHIISNLVLCKDFKRDNKFNNIKSFLFNLIFSNKENQKRNNILYNIQETKNKTTIKKKKT